MNESETVQLEYLGAATDCRNCGLSNLKKGSVITVARGVYERELKGNGKFRLITKEYLAETQPRHRREKTKREEK
ncbi:MAG: hypothetical protein LBJ25_07970 [Candidatus Margulisbacteria bacterium]|jgi:hypothetical protein|nr:hypothetical protein [Candidatus Margulisiibacteriota bacterium]